MSREPPVYPGLPLIGSLLDFRGDRANLLQRAAAEHGPVVAFQIGPRRIISIADPDLAAEVLLERHRHYVKQTRAYAMMRDGIGDGLLTSDGAFWARQRRIASPAFRRDRIGGFAQLMVDRATDLADAWSEADRVDVLPAMHRLAMRIAGQAFLGEDVGQWSDAIRTAFDDAIRLTTRRVLSPWAPPLWVPTPSNLRFKACIAELDQILGGIVATRRDAPDVGDDFLGRLMSATDDETGEGMSDRQLLDEVKTLFIAGFETVSNALSWAVYELARHPHRLAVLQGEADEHRGETPSLELVRSLAAARAVFQETLRRYPPVWAVGRTPIDDETIGGFRVPAGSWVFVSPIVLHHLPSHWPDPSRWDPDRFAPGAPGRHPHVYMPFLIGPRRCIGEHFAMMEGTLVLSTLASRLSWRLAADIAPVHPEPVVTLRPSGPITVEPQPRDD